MNRDERDDFAILTFEDRHRADFERLNRMWLEGHGILEDADLPYLVDPRATIIARGGQVYSATRLDRVVGVCGIVPRGAGVFELVKLAVDPRSRGAGIGRRLTEAALDFARAAGARSVILSTNHELVAAIHLYEKLGFVRRAPPLVRDYATADVYMEFVIER